MMEWYWCLADLLLQKNIANHPSTGVAGLQSQLEKHIIDLYQQLLLYQMKSVCHYYRHRGMAFLGDLVKVNNWEDQLSNILKAEETIRKYSKSFNASQIQTKLDNIASSGNSLLEELQGIQGHMAQQEKARRSEKEEQCLTDLRVTDPRDDKKRIETTNGTLLKDSYHWILENDDYLRWQDNSESRLLWIKGDPGKGKTMLLCGIIDELQMATNKFARPCYFFCQATEPTLNNATAVLRGLIYCLASERREFCSHILKKYNSSGQDLFKDINSWFALSDIFTGMIQDQSLSGQVFIIDALDECERDRPQLLDLIVNASAKSPAKWIVSSRNWDDIRGKLEPSSQMLSLELNEQSISNAVRSYVNHKVDKLGREKNLDNATQDFVRNHLSTNANGTFLWVALVCKELSKGDVQKRHMRKLMAMFPPELGPLYGRMLEQINGSRDADICKQILEIISLVYRPVSLIELASLLDMSQKPDSLQDLQEIVTSCGSFLVLREDGVVYFVHKSAKDFLFDKPSIQIFPSGVGCRHRDIFLRSLEILSTTLHRDMYNLRDLGPLKEDYTPNPDPLARVRYSCLFWVDHLRDASSSGGSKCESDLQDEGVVYKFLKAKLLYWLEGLSLISKMPEGVIALRTLDTLTTQKMSLMSKFIRDAYRFVLSHRAVIELAPLQVYASALIFSPASSVVRQTFETTQAPKWITAKPELEAEWGACLQTLEAHIYWVEAVAFSPDGAQLASGSGGGAVEIWDPATGACLQTLKGHADYVNAVAFLLDGRQLASASQDKTIKIWDLATGTCLQTLQGHNDSITSIALSPDSIRLASGSADNTIKIWDLAASTWLQTLQGHNSSINSIAFSPDGIQLTSGSKDKTIKIWDPATGACLQTLEYHGYYVNSIAFSPDGTRLALGSHARTINIWDLATGIYLQTLQGHEGPIKLTAFSPDGTRLASGSGNDTIKIWDLATSTCLQTLQGHGDDVNSIAFSPDGIRLASGSADNTIKIWDLTAGACLQTPHDSKRVVFSADITQLASVSGHGIVKILNVTTGACLRTLESQGSIGSVVFSPDNMWLAIAESSAIKIWDLATGVCLQTLEDHWSSVERILFSPDGLQLASVSEGDTAPAIKIWDPATGVCLQTLKDHKGSIRQILFSTEGGLLASASKDCAVKIWNLATGICLQTLEGHEGGVETISFSPDGLRLASVSYNKTGDSIFEIWDPATGVCLQTLEPRRVGRPVSVALSSDRALLASIAAYGTAVEIIDPATGVCLETLEGHAKNLSWDPVHHSRLHTDFGIFDVQRLVTDGSAKQQSVRCIRTDAFGLSPGNKWILKGRQPVLWLPPEHRPITSAVSEKRIVIGFESGEILCCEASVADLDAEMR